MKYLYKIFICFPVTTFKNYLIVTAGHLAEFNAISYIYSVNLKTT